MKVITRQETHYQAPCGCRSGPGPTVVVGVVEDDGEADFFVERLNNTGWARHSGVRFEAHSAEVLSEDERHRYWEDIEYG